MKNPKNIIVEYSANLRTLSTKSNIRIWLAQSLSSDSQKIRSFSIEPKSTSSYKDK